MSGYTHSTPRESGNHTTKCMVNTNMTQQMIGISTQFLYLLCAVTSAEAEELRLFNKLRQQCIRGFLRRYPCSCMQPELMSIWKALFHKATLHHNISMDAVFFET